MSNLALRFGRATRPAQSAVVKICDVLNGNTSRRWQVRPSSGRSWSRLKWDVFDVTGRDLGTLFPFNHVSCDANARVTLLSPSILSFFAYAVLCELD